MDRQRRHIVQSEWARSDHHGTVRGVPSTCRPLLPGPDGKQTSEVANLRPIIRRLKMLYGRTRAAAFGPLALKAIRQGMIDDGLARGTINKAVNRVRRIFKWAVENQLVEPNVLHGASRLSWAMRQSAKWTPGLRA